MNSKSKTGLRTTTILGATTLAACALLALLCPGAVEQASAPPRTAGLREGGSAKTLTTAAADPAADPVRAEPALEDAAGDAVARDPSAEARSSLKVLRTMVLNGRNDGRGAGRVAVKLLELIREDDDAIGPVLDRLRDGTVTEAEAANLIGLLGAANTAAAQRALVEILEDRSMRVTLRSMTVKSLVQTTDPIPEVDGALIRLSAEEPRLAANAFLALASLGNKVRESDPDRFDSIRRRVDLAAMSAESERDLRVAMWAVGNLGPQTVPGYVEDALANGDETLRQAAADALRRVSDEEADRMLTRLAREDDSALVRRAALDTLIRRHNDGQSPLARDGVSLRMLLEQVAESDPESRLRSWAAERASKI